MTLLITAQGDDIGSLVDPRFGRAHWFIVIDPASGDWRALDNGDNVNASGGAGVQAAGHVVSQGVDAIITGNVGPNAHRVLATAGVAVYHAGNGVTVREALAAFNDGKLSIVAAPTVAGHWT